MDFFNKLGKKTNEAYQSAKEKTVKLSGEIKLKSKISDLKEKINEQYKEIGKLVYEKIGSGVDASKEEITPRCEEISRLKSEIEKTETEILALKGIKKCVNCGSELEVGASFCSKCGKEQPKVEVAEKVEENVSTENVQDAEVTEVKTVEEAKDEEKEVSDENKETTEEVKEEDKTENEETSSSED